MVPNDPSLYYEAKIASNPRLPLAPLIFRASRRGMLEGSNPMPYPMETWGKVSSSPMHPHGNVP
jgi:hypothetical protein